MSSASPVLSGGASESGYPYGTNLPPSIDELIEHLDSIIEDNSIPVNERIVEIFNAQLVDLGT